MIYLIVFFLSYISMTIAKSSKHSDSITNSILHLEGVNMINKGHFKDVVEDLLTRIFIPMQIKQIKKLKVKRPPKKLSVPRNITRGSVGEARKNLIHAVISYCPTKKVFGLQCICEESYSEVNILTQSDSDASVTIAVDKKARSIIVSYRPAVSMQNFLTFLDYPLVDLPYSREGVKVHQGFYVNYLANYYKAREVVTTLLKDPKYKDFTLHITGYSLGAPVATISLGDWKSLLVSLNDTRKMEAYVYASPRPGNEKFAQYIASLNISATRYCHGKDWFTQMPARSFSYVHALPEIHETKDKNGKQIFIECNQEYDEDPNCGYTEENFSLSDHQYLFGSFAPHPPYCNK